MIISHLEPLGSTHHIQLVPSFDGKGNVTLTCLLRPKESDDPQDLITLQLDGPVHEVEASLPAHLSAATAKITTHVATMADLDAQLKAAETTKQQKLTAKVAAPVAAKGKPKRPIAAATTTAASDADDEDDGGDEEAAPASAAIPELKPAWASRPAAVAPADDADPVDLKSFGM